MKRIFSYLFIALSSINITHSQELVSWVDTSLDGSEKYVLRVDGKTFYMTSIQIRLDKLKGYLGWGDTALEAVVKQASDDGFNSVSIPICWRDVEPEKDKFDWTTLDKYMGWCKKYNLKMELLWFSWSSGGRIQWLTKNNKTSVKEIRVPDYVCSKEGTSEFKVVRNTDPWTLDWYDENLRNRERYVVERIMEHLAEWNDRNEKTNTVIGIQLGNEPHGHEITISPTHIIEYFHHVGAAVKDSKYKVWTRVNCVSWMTPNYIKANEKKRTNGGTNIDFVGIDVYGTTPQAVRGNFNGQMPAIGKNYNMIMEIDAKDAKVPIYQIAALSGNKAFNYYNMAAVDGNDLYTNKDTVLIERPHVQDVRKRNKILNMANQDIATKAHKKGLYVYNYDGNIVIKEEEGIDGISFMAPFSRAQAIGIRRSESEYVLLSTETGQFTIPDSLKIISASSGYFNKENKWVKEENIPISNNKINMSATSAIQIIIQK
ncbi:DUF4978 domain-containing protein [Dysgonomonas sp. GY75]|uniref:DUF4978 domain-containing protein n=1 Tax=Dysgonomonas sp. GY75 TaxID=2780419 RepID=UPI0018840F51|nr:DUF4978 domain-containing protein [Dysgonomonas sp. GY75]MBF0648205.1 DUF4978 domain-containing protein [Dysgonomonas sp. GY75]